VLFQLRLCASITVASSPMPSRSTWQKTECKRSRAAGASAVSVEVARKHHCGVITNAEPLHLGGAKQQCSRSQRCSAEGKLSREAGHSGVSGGQLEWRPSNFVAVAAQHVAVAYKSRAACGDVVADAITACANVTVASLLMPSCSTRRTQNVKGGGQQVTVRCTAGVAFE
jgi:hypothetical protein